MQSHIKMILQFSLLWAVSVLLLCIGAFGAAVALMGIVSAFYTARLGLVRTLPWLVPACIAAYFFQDSMCAILFGSYTLPAFAIGAFLFFSGKFSGMLITATLLQTVAFTGHTLWVCALQAKTPSALLLTDGFEKSLGILSSSGQFNAETLSTFEGMFRMLSMALQSMFPFLYLSAALLCVYVLFLIVRSTLSKTGADISFMPCFHELWLPRSVSTIFVFIFVLSFFTSSMILSNVVSFMFMLHVICGISVIDFYMRAKGMSGGIRALLIAAILAFSSMLGGLATSILCYMGMSDSGRGIRK